MSGDIDKMLQMEMEDTKSADDGSTCQSGRKFIITIRALLVRVLLMVHGLISIWRVVVATSVFYYWGLLLVLLLLPIEMVMTLRKTRRGEWTWFCPCFLIFLCAVIPVIWVLELNRLSHLRHSNSTIEIVDELNQISRTARQENLNTSDMDSIKQLNVTDLGVTDGYWNMSDWNNITTNLEISVVDDLEYNLTKNGVVKNLNGSTIKNILWPNGTTIGPNRSKREVDKDSNSSDTNVPQRKPTGAWYDLAEKIMDGIDQTIPGTHYASLVDLDIWVLILEQSMLFLLIICRWILPRGEITEDQLSQLMFVFVGMSSDIMDLFTLFEDTVISKNFIITCAILGVWTLSVMQFTFVLTVTKARKSRVAHAEEVSEATKKKQRPVCACVETEIWALLVTVLMQDGPFLALRLYIMIVLNVMNYSLLFFTAKNVLIVFVQIYRILVILYSQCVY